MDKNQNDTLEAKTREVVITATKYPERIMEIPLSVSIITQESITNKRGYGLDEVLNLTPGVLAQSRFGNQDIRLTIRGFGARGAGDRSNAGTSRGIKVYLDGMPETEPDGRTSFDNIDISLARNIEVIRSNASSLWGNAAGGVVSITSMPSFTDPFIRIGAQGGSYGYRKYIAETGTPIGQGRISAAFTSTLYDGYRDNSSSERYIGNIGIITPLTEKSFLGVFMQGVSNRFYIPGPLTQQQFDSMPSMANPD
ncbi:MAG TPA: Plug domain-containing protein, partial [Ignavibacteriales bacterium]|nr:Plug domain-containing protein [Ignavibacteriales bacterium]